MQLLKKFKLSFFGLILLFNSGIIYTAARIVNEDLDIRSLDDEQPVKKLKTSTIIDRGNAAIIKVSEEEMPKKSSKLDFKLIIEVTTNNIEGVRKLLDLKVNVNTADELGWTPLLQASRKGYLDLVKLLINSGANVDLGNKEGRTPTIITAAWNHYETLKSLIEAGANLDASDNYGNTALIEAVRSGYKQIVKLLLYAGADLDKKKNEKTALEFSHNVTHLTEKRKKGMPQITKLLEDEPERRIKAINQWLKSNKSVKAKNINEKIKEITQATGYSLLPDLAQLISEYNIEYTDIPLADRLADLENSENGPNILWAKTARELVW